METIAGRYRLLERVGRGAMGVVWHARDEKLERDVAIKLLHAFVAAEREQRLRFDREARTLASLTSEHIVKLYDYVDVDEQVFLVMEYVEGSNLAQATFGRLPLSFADAAAYAAPVAQALAYAHARGVVHRDLAPTNILIGRSSGRVVTTDFGLARIVRSGSLTATGSLIGTPEYWSPEQALGGETDGAADVYALGCILFLLLSGRLPFEGDDRLSIGLRRAHEDAPSLQAHRRRAPQQAIALVDAMLARAPRERPDAAAVAAALARAASNAQPRSAPAQRRSAAAATIVLPAEQPTLLDDAPPATIAPSRPVTDGRRRLRQRGLAAAAAVLVTITAALVLAGHLHHSPPRAPNLVALRETVARARIAQTVPHASVSVARIYSTRVPLGRVIRQHPSPGVQLGRDTTLQLIVSKGSPFAPVPTIAAGSQPQSALAVLARAGFRGRYVYTSSWTIRKGTVVGLQPAAGILLHRPARVEVVIASGYPRSIVPNVYNIDLATAQTHLAATHLRYHVVYRLAQNVPPNRVLSQIPAAGANVYQQTTIRLTVARTLQWVKVFAASGTRRYESVPFTVPGRWRIRYRLTGNNRTLPALAHISWIRGGQLFADGFIATTPAALQSYPVPDGAGSYTLSVIPFARTGWYIEVDAFR